MHLDDLCVVWWTKAFAGDYIVSLAPARRQGKRKRKRTSCKSFNHCRVSSARSSVARAKRNSPRSKTPPPGARRNTLGAKPMRELGPRNMAAPLTLIHPRQAFFPHQPQQSGIRPFSGSVQLYSGLDDIDWRVSFQRISDVRGSSHGVFKAVPTKPPTVPARRLLPSSPFFD
jgi:hypothetical protein